MADNQAIDTLELKINSDAGKAVDGLDRLAGTLLKLKNSLGGGWIGNMKDLSSNMHSLSGATKKLDSGKLTGFATALGQLGGSVTALAAVSGDLTPAINNLQQLSAFDFSKLKVSGDFSGLDTLAKGMAEMANVAPRLSALKATDINKTLSTFEKLGKTDFNNVAASLQSLAGLDTGGFVSLSQSLGMFAGSAEKLAALGRKDMNAAIRNIERMGTINFSGLAQSMAALSGVDFSRLAALGQAFQSFSNSLSGAEQISNGTVRIFNSLGLRSLFMITGMLFPDGFPAFRNGWKQTLCYLLYRDSPVCVIP